MEKGVVADMELPCSTVFRLRPVVEETRLDGALWLPSEERFKHQAFQCHYTVVICYLRWQSEVDVFEDNAECLSCHNGVASKQYSRARGISLFSYSCC